MATGRNLAFTAMKINFNKNLLASKNFLNFFGRAENNSRLNRGITLAELVISIAIFAALALLIGLFGKNIFSFNYYIQADLGAQMEGRRAVAKMVSEMREMSPSSLGAYPIAVAATSSITFYSDIDGDPLKEKVRYYIQNGKVLKSVAKLGGSPPSYDFGSAVITTVAQSVANGTSTPLFEYYDANYAGTSTPLSIPVNISSVKLVKINLLVSRQSSTSAVPLLITSQVTPRNLKDNL